MWHISESYKFSFRIMPVLFFNYNVSVLLNTCKQRNAMIGMCMVTVVSKICFYSFKWSLFYCFTFVCYKLIHHTNVAPILYFFPSLILFESYLTCYNIRFWKTIWKWDNILQLVVIFLVIPPSILRQFTKFAEINGYIDCMKEYFNSWMQAI